MGHVLHTRYLKERMRFRYPSYMLWLDLDELDVVENSTRWFGHNRRRLLSLRDTDYLTPEPRPIREKLRELLTSRGVEWPAGGVYLLTAPRYFNYVFNPVSFYFGYDEAGALRWAVAEVNNTFGEKHIYVLDDASRASGEAEYRFTCNKEFHVSPFMDLAGRYDFVFRFEGDALDVRIDLLKQEQMSVEAQLVGKFFPITSTSLANVVLRYPFTGMLTMTRIVVQATKLAAQRARVYGRPSPASTDTIGRRAQARTATVSARLAMSVLARFRKGRLDLLLPNGERHTYGEPDAEPIEWQVHDWRAFRAIMMDGDIGLGESYMAGDWSTNDLAGFIALFLKNKEAVEAVEDGRWVQRLGNRLLGWYRRNHIKGSRRNISAHYDLSNEMFELFLDPTMTYSSAYFEQPDQSLEEAQNVKYRKLCEKVELKDGDRLLEIGCGWGGFACFAARYANCRVTAITISQQQFDYAVERVKREGLADRVEIVMQDYRTLTGEFDKIVSIEMFEAVGYEYYPAYFQAVDRVLAPGGRFAMQTITFPDADFDHYRKTFDWIRKYIFPGGLLPSMQSIRDTIATHTRLGIIDEEDIALSYARTLGIWRDQFNAQWEKVSALGFDLRFQRMWNFYLAYCEGAFATRYLGDMQLVFSKNN
jgi:cyclopropane-fatty-acyl-phospholipid synthase